MNQQRNAESLKRLACTITAQLPEDHTDALCVLNYCREILINLGTAWEMPGPAILPIRRFALVATGPGDPE